MKKITIQHAAPASNGTQVVSALPHACNTLNNAMPAPPQMGSSRMAMMNLIHFGTRKNSEFRIQKPAESAFSWGERPREPQQRSANSHLGSRGRSPHRRQSKLSDFGL
jgi:hypothetical protein